MTIYECKIYIIIFGILITCVNYLYAVYQNASLVNIVLSKMAVNVEQIDFVQHNIIPSTSHLITSNGFYYKLYQIESKDGYLLQIHRIVNTGPPVIIQPGFITASDAIVMRDRNLSLAFQLADAGYDVWLSDQRGNWYSRKHIKYKRNDPRFWNFSFHECGYYDLPAIIDEILAISGYNQVYYIGHSMGATIFLVMNSLRPVYNQKVRAAILLAPIAVVRNDLNLHYSPLSFILNRADALYNFFLILGQYEFLPRSPTTINWIRKICTPSLFQRYCLNILALVTGEHRENIDTAHIHDQLSYLPAGSSLKTAHHLSQLFKNGFRQYDYGTTKNLLTYGMKVPPLYPIQNITTPTAIYWGKNDIYIDHKSILELGSKLRRLIKCHQVEDPKFNHIDFILGKNSAKLVNQDVISVLENFPFNL